MSKLDGDKTGTEGVRLGGVSPGSRRAQQNREAQRLFRARRRERMEQLEKTARLYEEAVIRISELERENALLRERLQMVDHEKEQVKEHEREEVKEQERVWCVSGVG